MRREDWKNVGRRRRRLRRSSVKKGKRWNKGRQEGGEQPQKETQQYEHMKERCGNKQTDKQKCKSLLWLCFPGAE